MLPPQHGNKCDTKQGNAYISLAQRPYLREHNGPPHVSSLEAAGDARQGARELAIVLRLASASPRAAAFYCKLPAQIEPSMPQHAHATMRMYKCKEQVFWYSPAACVAVCPDHGRFAEG